MTFYQLEAVNKLSKRTMNNNSVNHILCGWRVFTSHVEFIISAPVSEKYKIDLNGNIEKVNRDEKGNA